MITVVFLATVVLFSRYLFLVQWEYRYGAIILIFGAVRLEGNGNSQNEEKHAINMLLCRYAPSTDKKFDYNTVSLPLTPSR